LSITDYLYSITPLHGLLGRLLGVYIRFLAITCKFQITGQEYYQKAIESGLPVFYIFWHQQYMPVVTFGWKTFDLDQFVVIVEGRNRGSILTYLTKSLRVNKAIQIDMDGNPLVAAQRLLEIIRFMQGGKYSMLSPDGPKGPPNITKPGAIFIARKANAIIIPCGAWSRRSIQLNRWDRYLVPLPFSHIAIVFREPIHAKTNSLNDKHLEEFTTNEMNAARDYARKIAGGTISMP
jgi:lysophospholipid acyltransferase (LPLAT)-like uncharacterized protein